MLLTMCRRNEPELATRDGRFRVRSSTWDHNGSFHVVVHDTEPTSDPTPEEMERERRRARDLARRVDTMRDVIWVRVDSVERHEDHVEYRLTASRLDLMYR